MVRTKSSTCEKLGSIPGRVGIILGRERFCSIRHAAVKTCLVFIV